MVAWHRDLVVPVLVHPKTSGESSCVVRPDELRQSLQGAIDKRRIDGLQHENDKTTLIQKRY